MRIDEHSGGGAKIQKKITENPLLGFLFLFYLVICIIEI